jgi:hypothetical protein
MFEVHDNFAAEFFSDATLPPPVGESSYFAGDQQNKNQRGRPWFFSTWFLRPTPLKGW